MNSEIMKEYEIKNLGLPYPVTVLNGVEVERNPETGEIESESIINYEGFIRTLAIIRCAISNILTGEEIRFLRTVRGMKAIDLALELGVEPETVSRWENNKRTIPETPERLLRVATCLDLQQDGLTPSVKYDVLLSQARRAQFPDSQYPTIVLGIDISDDTDSSEGLWNSEMAA